MTEVQFAKSFLGALDGRPVKLQADYIEDPKSYPSRPPYTLPRMPKPMKKPASASSSTSAPGQAPAITVSIKSLHRTQPLDVVLARPAYAFALATTSLLDVRTALSETSHVPVDKLRLLYNKKPVSDSKVLKDLVADESETEIKLGVMVAGGAETVAAAAEAAASVAAAQAKAATAPTDGQETPTAIAAESEAFWNDLRGFLVKRTGSKTQADELFSLFLRSWEERMI
ncbi:uncharacterized protein SPSK_01936 [Sporothrix schenckii 1099-18]|uniref:Ubiquitin-like domain-containing protein n=2 Tax=Sporothrix schenckii TaxID=29908 RepID=U7PJZ8_SPOS1|nr:uncharacterized protein SPSK_01936 [Sporothrix schenckii 1099-18]ERS95049.1 hypothetical protein HMPREF1624_08538 [Sporothrix schenckii ATCC 58251]KJR87341.1 hypothetical protein SPSK_01936 [Sporothrix schenckii 1099-18]